MQVDSSFFSPKEYLESSSDPSLMKMLLTIYVINYKTNY